VTRGWSVNLSSVDPDHTFEVDLPIDVLYVGQFGPVVEIVFWSQEVDLWVHVVRHPFERELPSGHVQVSVGDMAWIERQIGYGGNQGLRDAVAELREEYTL
jgi:hypothetical protein